MNAPVRKKRGILSLASVAILAIAFTTHSAFASVAESPRDPSATAKLVTQVPIPLPDGHRLPDLTAPVFLAMLPDPVSPAHPGPTDIVLDQLMVSGSLTHDLLDDRAVLDEPAAEAFYAVVRAATSPSLLRVRHTPGRRPAAVQPSPPFQPADPLPLLLNVVSADGAAPTLAVPIPASDHATTVDFTALLNADGDVILQPSDDPEKTSILVPPGRFAVNRLELGRTRARLEMDDCQFAVAHGVRLMPNGRIITHVRSAPAGLDLSEDAFLDISRGAKIILLWHGAPTVEGIHWGMRAKGDRREEFRELIRTGRIIIGKLENGAMAISKAVIIFDGEYTYITIDFPVYDKPIHSRNLEIRLEPQEIPEPATILLLSLGACPLLRKRP